MASSIELTFLRDTAQPKSKGPYRSVRFEGEIIRAEAGAPIIAKHERHEWVVDGEPYSRLQCNGRTAVHFERIDGARWRWHLDLQNVDHRHEAQTKRGTGDCAEDRQPQGLEDQQSRQPRSNLRR